MFCSSIKTFYSGKHATEPEIFRPPGMRGAAEIAMPDAQQETAQFHDFLRAFLHEHTAFLKKVLRVYVLRMGLVSGENVSVMVDEIFQDTILQIMTHSERFMSVQEPRAWFLAVAGNLLKRRRARQIRRERFEVLTSELALGTQALNEAELLDGLTGTLAEGPEKDLESREQVEEMLALVSPDDARVLGLSILHDLDAQRVAGQLGISLNATRVRLHRALQRLRQAWSQRENHQPEERR